MTSGGWMDERKSSTSLSQRIKPLNSLKQGQRQKFFMFVKDKDKYHTSLGSMGPVLSSPAAVSGKNSCFWQLAGKTSLGKFLLVKSRALQCAIIINS